MKLNKKILCAMFVLLVGLLSMGSSDAAFYIPNIDGSANPYPPTEHLDWINRTYTYNSSTASEFAIQVRMWAPDNWNTPGNQNGIDYDTYQPDDQSYTYANIQWGLGLNQNFDDVYSYFYKVTNASGSNDLTQLSIPFDPATGVNYGYVDDDDGENPTSIGPLSSNLQIGLALTGTETSEWFFMTSQYWWGWQQLSYNAGTDATGQTQINSIYYSPDGMIPAPNPEAPTVALYIVGLLVMGWLTRLKLRQRELL